MAEQASKTVRPAFTVTVNDQKFEKDQSYDLPTELANEVERLSRQRFEAEMRRIDGQAPVSNYLSHMG